MPVYTVVGTQYCAPRSGFLRLRRGPTRTSAARTLRITSRSKAEAVRMYRKAVGVGRDCELKIYASPESVQPNRRRTSRRTSAARRGRVAPNGEKVKVASKKLQQRMGWALAAVKSLRESDALVAALREAQRAVVYAELLGDAKTQAKANKAANLLNARINSQMHGECP